MPADRPDTDVGPGAVATQHRWGWQGALVVGEVSAPVVGGSARGVTQDGVGGYGGSERGGVRLGVDIRVMSTDQAAVGVANLGLRGIWSYAKDCVQVVIVSWHHGWTSPAGSPRRPQARGTPGEYLGTPGRGWTDPRG